MSFDRTLRGTIVHVNVPSQRSEWGSAMAEDSPGYVSHMTIEKTGN